MSPEFNAAELRKTKLQEYVIRFVFGGTIAVVAFAVGERFGPHVGGLFLSFPALLPAGLTLVKQHDGRQAAEDDARGAELGSIALAVFALVVWIGSSWWPPLALLLALLAWVGVSVTAWIVVHARSIGSQHRS